MLMVEGFIHDGMLIGHQRGSWHIIGQQVLGNGWLDDVDEGDCVGDFNLNRKDPISGGV